MNELESDIGKLSSLIDSKLCTKAGCPDELAQLRQLLHLQIIEARALASRFLKRILNASFLCRTPLAK